MVCPWHTFSGAVTACVPSTTQPPEGSAGNVTAVGVGHAGVMVTGLWQRPHKGTKRGFSTLKTIGSGDTAFLDGNTLNSHYCKGHYVLISIQEVGRARRHALAWGMLAGVGAGGGSGASGRRFRLPPETASGRWPTLAYRVTEVRYADQRIQRQLGDETGGNTGSRRRLGEVRQGLRPRRHSQGRNKKGRPHAQGETYAP
jgi:hypothetical protein